MNNPKKETTPGIPRLARLPRGPVILPPCHAPLTSPIHKSANPPPSPLLSSSLPFPSFHFPCKTQPEWLLSRKENHITVRAAYVGRHPTRGRRGASRLPIPEFLFFFPPQPFPPNISFSFLFSPVSLTRSSPVVRRRKFVRGQKKRKEKKNNHHNRKKGECDLTIKKNEYEYHARRTFGSAMEESTTPELDSPSRAQYRKQRKATWQRPASNETTNVATNQINKNSTWKRNLKIGIGQRFIAYHPHITSRLS